MFEVLGLNAGQLAVACGVGLLLEVLLLWASTALANTPEYGWPRLALTSLPFGAVAFGAVYLVAWWVGRLETESLWPTVLYSALGVVGVWAVSTVLIVPLLSVSLSKGMLVTVLQSVLRLFLYVLIVAVLMFFLAVFQIRKGGTGTPRAQASAPAVQPAALS
jgi:hypothetical protein